MNKKWCWFCTHQYNTHPKRSCQLAFHHSNATMIGLLSNFSYINRLFMNNCSLQQFKILACILIAFLSYKSKFRRQYGKFQLQMKRCSFNISKRKHREYRQYKIQMTANYMNRIRLPRTITITRFALRNHKRFKITTSSTMPELHIPHFHQKVLSHMFSDGFQKKPMIIRVKQRDLLFVFCLPCFGPHKMQTC